MGLADKDVNSKFVDLNADIDLVLLLLTAGKQFLTFLCINMT